MPYTIAFPPLHTLSLSKAPVIPVMEPVACAGPPRLLNHPVEQSCQVRSKFLEMTLADFEAQRHALHVRVPWWPETLWLVSSSTEAEILYQEGISRGRIWTAKELRYLVEIGDVTQKELHALAEIKRVFGVRFTRIQRTNKAREHWHISHGTPNGCPWPSSITGMGPKTLGSFTCCSVCGDGTWARYGETVLCRRHAINEASQRGATSESR